MQSAFELGLYTFGDLMPEAAGAQQRLAEILAAAKLADASGLDVFAVGEHHRLDMAVAATPVVLAAIAAVTERIRLASAVTILSTADPVLVFEDFATVDLISGGRAEIIAGRGIFTESFPLFGYDLADYDDLFAEKLELLMQLNAAERVTWQGRFRPPLKDAPIPPRPAASSAPASSVCRWHLPTSACRRRSLRRSPISTGAQECKPGTPLAHSRSASPPTCT
jgi:alkanesulfonate monooxygenase SsuD/methylene tetrahydromethanopterin reductase-like flavin-dependent oxidoreductase (luciferase family)